MRFRKRYIVVPGVILCLGTLLSLIFFTGDGYVVGRAERQVDIQLEIGVWDAETLVEQTFIASQSNLARIDFFLDAYYPWKSPYLLCRLFEIESSEIPANLSYEFVRRNMREVRSKRLNGWLLSTHMFNSFSFEPIPDSQDTRYLLSIQSPGLKPGKAFAIMGSAKQKRYKFGNLFVNGRKKGALAFRALYRQSRLEILDALVERLTLQKPPLFSQTTFYYILFGVYFCLIGLLMLFFLIGISTFKEKNIP